MVVKGNQNCIGLLTHLIMPKKLAILCGTSTMQYKGETEAGNNVAQIRITAIF